MADEGNNTNTEEGLFGRGLKLLLGEVHGTDLSSLAVLLLAIGFVVFLIFGVIGDLQVLDRLASTEYARGLITFILAVGTMAIAILVTVGGLLAKGDPTEADKRFSRGKEILAILVGVLGTIVGFYYGSQAGEAGREMLSVSVPLISNSRPLAGEKISLTCYFHGGVPPYQYEISFENAPENVAWRQRKGQVNEAGWAVEEFELKDAKPGKLMYTIKATDARKTSKSYTSDKSTCIQVQGKQDEKPKGKPAQADGNTPGRTQAPS